MSRSPGNHNSCIHLPGFLLIPALFFHGPKVTLSNRFGHVAAASEDSYQAARTALGILPDDPQT